MKLPILSFRSFQLIFEGKLDDISEKHGVDKDTVKKIAKADPSHMGEYTDWLVGRHKEGDFGDPDNLNHIEHHREVLSNFHRAKTAIPHVMEDHDVSPDIHSYENTTKLADAIHPFVGKKIFDKDGYTAHHITTAEQGEFHGHGTKWCTGAKNNCHVESYLKNGGLVAFQPPNKKEAYQWHTNEEGEMSSELKNKGNADVEPHKLETKHPVLKDMPAWHHFKETKANEHDDDHDHFHDDDDGNEHYEEDQVYGTTHRRIQAVSDLAAHHRYPHLYDDGSHEVRKAIILHEEGSGPQSRDAIHDRYKDDTHEEVRAHVAEHAHSSDIINHMYEHHVKGNHDDDVAYGLASNPRAPHHILSSLAEHPDVTVRSRVSDNSKSHQKPDSPHYSSEISHKLLDHESNENSVYRNIAEIATNTSSGDHTLLDRMGSHKDGKARATAAHYDPEHFFDKLKDDPEPMVRANLAAHRPEHFTDPKKHEPVVRRWAATFAKPGDGVHDKLVHDPDADVRAHVAQRGEDRHKIALMNDPSEEVQQTLQRGMSNSSKDVMNAAAHSNHTGTRATAASHIHEGPGMYKLLGDHEPNVRGNLARNRNLPAVQRKHLANDSNEFVKRSALTHIRSYGE